MFHDAALALFEDGRYGRAMPLLGRLALGLPIGHPLRAVVRGALARAYADLGRVEAASRQLEQALAAEPENETFRDLARMLRELAHAPAPGATGE